MPSLHTIAIRIARRLRRWLPGVESIAGASAAAGDPAPLLDLGSDRPRDHVTARHE